MSVLPRELFEIPWVPLSFKHITTSLSQEFLVLHTQVTCCTPEPPRKPSQPPPRPPPDFLQGGALPAPLLALLNRTDSSSPGVTSQVERKESSRKPPPSRPVPPAPSYNLSQVSGFSEVRKKEWSEPTAFSACWGVQGTCRKLEPFERLEIDSPASIPFPTG